MYVFSSFNTYITHSHGYLYKDIPPGQQFKWDLSRQRKHRRHVHSLASQIRRFASSPNGPQTLSFPPANKATRKLIHELAEGFRLKSVTNDKKGEGLKYTTLSKKKRGGEGRKPHRRVEKILKNARGMVGGGGGGLFEGERGKGGGAVTADWLKQLQTQPKPQAGSSHQQANPSRHQVSQDMRPQAQPQAGPLYQQTNTSRHQVGQVMIKRLRQRPQEQTSQPLAQAEER